MRPYQNHATMQGHIAQWHASNLTQAAYCKEHGIKPHIFSYYKKKFSSDSEIAKQSSQLITVKLVANDGVTRFKHMFIFRFGRDQINPYQTRCFTRSRS